MIPTLAPVPHDTHTELKSPDTWQIRFLGDPSGEAVKALDLDFDSTAIFGNRRSKRFALVIEDGKVKEAHVEPDNTGTSGKIATSSGANCFLPSLTY